MVLTIKKNSLAYLNGISLGDEVKSIDNIDVKKFTLTTGIQALNRSRILTFKGIDGTTKIIEE